MLSDPRPLLSAARAAHSGIGAFNVIQLEHAEAYAAAAEATGKPLVLQISENCVRYHGSLRPIAAATIEIARGSSAALVVHLDHAESVELIDEALALGFTSIMYDGSKLDFDANVATTKAVVAKAHEHGAAVEAEIGEIGGKDGVHAPGVRTSPEDAAYFASATGVDSLAVAVGSSHAMATRDARLDLDLIAAIAAAVPLPLVLHGSSGVPDEGLSAAVAAGMTKINIATHLNHAMTDAVRAFLTEHETVTDSRKWLGAGREAITREVIRLQTLLGR